MKAGVIISIVVLIIIVIAIAGFAINREKVDEMNDNGMGDAMSNENTSSQPPAPPSNDNNSNTEIYISNFLYSPASITINSGDTVIWTNSILCNIQ
jgi:plastocyanin